MSLEVPKDVYAIYMIEISFYLHSLYTTLFVDQWRRDSIVLMGHHIVTSLLLVFSLSIRWVLLEYWKISSRRHKIAFWWYPRCL